MASLLSGYSSKSGSSYTEGVGVTKGEWYQTQHPAYQGRQETLVFPSWLVAMHMNLLKLNVRSIKAKLMIKRMLLRQFTAYRPCPENTFQTGWSAEFENPSLMMLMRDLF